MTAYTDLSQKYNITVEAQGRINPGITTAIVGQLPFSEFKYKDFVDLLGSIPKEFVHSLTPDHGREFLGLNDIRERLGVAIYWPDPYSPEERGTNENTNGLIREYFPKRTNIDDYTDKDVSFCQHQLNRRPRKVLNYETPYEVFFEKPLHLV